MSNFTNEIWHQRYWQNGDSIIDSENGLIDFDNKSFMNSGIDKNGAILLMNSDNKGIGKMVIQLW